MVTGFWPIAAITGEFLVRLALVVFILLRRPPRTATTLAWITVVLAIPLLGIIAYMLVGEVRLGRRRIRRHAEIHARLHDPAEPRISSAQRRPPEIPPAYRSIATLAEAVGGNRPMGGNGLQLLGNTDLFVESLVTDIDDARDHCHLLFYIFLDDHSGRRVAEAMSRAARRGVVCRLLVDAVGSRTLARSTLRREMAAAGVRVVEALPANPLRMLFARLDLRNHRKLVVIDGARGYVGSQNIADAEFAPKPRFAPWVDAMVRADGPVVRDLQTLFAEDWFLDTGESLESLLSLESPRQEDGVVAQVMGTGPNAYNEALHLLIMTAIQTARREVVLTTPYFVPDVATSIALRTAARSGVETMVIVPERNDSPLVAAASRSAYEALLEAGVKIFEFRGGLLHAKTLTLDRDLALISSANFDRRSFELNLEVSMVVYDTDFASQVRFLQTSYLAQSTLVDLARWRRRSVFARLAQNAAGTLSPLL